MVPTSQKKHLDPTGIFRKKLNIKEFFFSVILIGQIIYIDNRLCVTKNDQSINHKRTQNFL